MRTYEQTHKWLTFLLDLRKAPWELWEMLGECKACCEHIAGQPLRPDTATRLYRLYLARGVHATTAIEGNTLSEDEVRQQIEGALRLPPSRAYLANEVDNIVVSCNVILDCLSSGMPPALNRAWIADLNKFVLAELNLEDEVVPGAIRQHSIVVARYHGAPAEDCPHLLDELCKWLNGDAFRRHGKSDIVFSILKAVMAHLYLAWIHPFGDGNGRTARLVEFQILLESGVPAPAAHLLSNHYNNTRTEYYRQLDRASRSGGDVMPFVRYAVQGFLDGLKEQVNEIREQQWDVAWRDYVYEKFRDQSGDVANRRRRLVLDLSRQHEPVPVSSIPSISPRLAEAYARKTPKTLTRDVNALVAMGLAAKESAGVRARKELILAFLPPTTSSPAPPSDSRAANE